MSKTTDTQQSKTSYELSPEQRQIMQSSMAQYMPGGQLPTHAPTFDYNTNSTLQDSGANYVAPFSTPTQQAFAATEANFGAQQPTMDAAKGLTMSGAANAGQMQGAPDGWTTGPDGQAKYQDYATGINKYMSPFTSGVINTGLGFLDTARQRQNLSTNNDSVSKGSFGGTRQAVRQNLDDTAYAAQAQNLISSNLQHGFEGAQAQYNTGFGQGQQALGYNTGVAQADRAARTGAGAQLGQQALQNQQLTGNDINALSGVGSAIEGKDQAMRDAARATQMQDATYGINIGQAISGFAPPPSSSTYGSKGVTAGSAIGTGIGTGLSAMMMMPSDERAKKGIEDADPHDSLAEIRKLKPKKFEYTKFAQDSIGVPGGERPGFMAQDMEKATGRPAPHAGGGFKGVDMAEHIGRLTHAVQALDEKMRGRYGPSKGKKAA